MASSGQYWSTFKLVFIAIWHVSSNIWISECRNTQYHVMYKYACKKIILHHLQNIKKCYIYMLCVLKIWISRCAWFNIKLACTIFVKIIMQMHECHFIAFMKCFIPENNVFLPYINLKKVSYNQCSISVEMT